MLPVMLELEDGIRLQRALDREKLQAEPKYAEMCRRFLADSEDFSEEKIAEADIEKRFCNVELNRCLDEIRDYILHHAAGKQQDTAEMLTCYTISSGKCFRSK